MQTLYIDEAVAFADFDKIMSDTNDLYQVLVWAKDLGTQHTGAFSRDDIANCEHLLLDFEDTSEYYNNTLDLALAELRILAANYVLAFCKDRMTHDDVYDAAKRLYHYDMLPYRNITISPEVSQEMRTLLCLMSGALTNTRCWFNFNYHHHNGFWYNMTLWATEEGATLADLLNLGYVAESDPRPSEEIINSFVDEFLAVLKTHDPAEYEAYMECGSI